MVQVEGECDFSLSSELPNLVPFPSSVMYHHVGTTLRKKVLMTLWYCLGEALVRSDLVQMAATHLRLLSKGLQPSAIPLVNLTQVCNTTMRVYHAVCVCICAI